MFKETDRVVLLNVDNTKKPAKFLFFSINGNGELLKSNDEIESPVDIEWAIGNHYRLLGSATPGKLNVERLPDIERSICKVKIEPKN